MMPSPINDSSLPTFSLIVCSVDRFDPLERLFSSLRKQTGPAFEVILVDQNDDHRLVPLVEAFSPYFPINHIHSSRGLSRARNVGIAAATGTYIGFPDDDCWYEPYTLAIADRLFAQSPNLAVVTGRTLDADDLPSVSPTGPLPLTISRQNYLSCGNSNGIFVHRLALATVGSFDENLGVGSQSPFQSGEEADLLLRAITAGLKLGYFPTLVVHHDQVITRYDEAQISRAHRYGLGFGALMRKQHFSIVYLSYRLARPLASLIVATVRCDSAVRQYKWAWLSGIAAGYATWPRWDNRNANYYPDAISH